MGDSKITMQQLKEQSLTPPEKFVLNKIKGVKASEPDRFGYIAWRKDGEWLFMQDFKGAKLWISDFSIWLVLNKEYGLSEHEIDGLLARLLHKYTNNGQLKIS